MLAARIEMLQQMPIFGAVRDDALRLLLEPTRTVEVGAGDYFFREGEPAQCMFVLEAGGVEVLKQWRGREMVLRSFGAGDCFGEMALLDLFPRSAAVRASAPCRAIELTPGDLLRLYEHDAAQFALIQMNIGREMCRRLRTTDEQLFQAVMGEAPAMGDTQYTSI
jgi:CRP/FNR family transcriptional regulator, cyclic AMP receptor protein